MTTPMSAQPLPAHAPHRDAPSREMPHRETPYGGAALRSTVGDRSGRTNQQWLDELSGRCAPATQRQAHEDLARHLHRLAYTCLLQRRANVPHLQAFTGEELAILAQSMVQELLEQLARNNFALLAHFGGQGRFLSWMAQVLQRAVANKLRMWM